MFQRSEKTHCTLCSRSSHFSPSISLFLFASKFCWQNLKIEIINSKCYMKLLAFDDNSLLLCVIKKRVIWKGSVTVAMAINIPKRFQNSFISFFVCALMMDDYKFWRSTLEDNYVIIVKRQRRKLENIPISGFSFTFSNFT